MPIKTLGSGLKVRVGREAGNRTIFMFDLMSYHLGKIKNITSIQCSSKFKLARRNITANLGLH